MELLFILLSALALFAIGKVTIPTDPEKGLKRLLELRGQEDLSEDEKEELDALENRLKDAFSEAGNDGGMTDEDLDKFLDRYIAKSGKKDEDDKEDRDIHNPEAENIEVGDPRTPDWVKRTVKWVNAGIAKARDEPQKADNLFRGLKSDVREMTPKLQASEQKIVVDKAKEVKERAGSAIVCTPSYRNIIKRMAQAGYVRTLSIGTDSAGGFLLPKPFLAEIAVIIEERGVARNLFRGIPMDNDSIDLKNVATKPSAAWTNENALITESDPAFGDGSLDANKLAAITSWSRELQEDSAFAFIPLIAELFAEAILEKEDDAGFVGGGTSTHGGFTGILNLSSASTLTLATGKVAETDADLDDYRKLRDQLSLAKRRSAIYVMHPDIESDLEGKKSSDGLYLYRRPGDGAAPGNLWGHPIVLTESMPSTASTSTKFVAFGNPVYMLFGMRRGLMASQSTDGVLSNSSNDVTYNAFQQDGVLWKITERIAFQAQIESAFANMQTAAS